MLVILLRRQLCIGSVGTLTPLPALLLLGGMAFFFFFLLPCSSNKEKKRFFLTEVTNVCVHECCSPLLKRKLICCFPQ